ncbi:uncharacterized protein LOC111038767 [Myzus persicae]|uniref:uncharacterized protein LOC111038767 n=1 Tax=Myzus persicae TaxID=13164 RepID=UPI000B9317D1|nr:uncharacterized protein LOC111038767 [Myzus persicae]
MEFTTKILILLAVISFVSVDSITPEEEERNIKRGLRGLLCPPLGKENKFELATLQTETKMYGCAYLGFDNLSSSDPLFHLWVEDPDYVIGTSGNFHGNCHHTYQMDHFIFKCLSKDKPTNKVEILKGWQYTSLLEYAADNNSINVIPTKSYRCALYKVTDNDDMKIRVIRLVISKPEIRDEFHVSLCENFPALLGRNDLPVLPKGLRYWPDGSMFLHLLGRKPSTPNE